MKRWFTLLIFITFSNHIQVYSQSPEKAGFPKIGYTNVDLVMGQLPESKAMQNQLEITRTQLEKAIDESIKEFQGKAEIYQKTASQMTEIIRADKEKELDNLQARVQEMRSKAQQSLQIKQQQLMEPIQTKINTAIQQVGKEHSYVYIFNMDGGLGTVPFILFASAEENNVTNLILKKLGINPDEPKAPESSGKSDAPSGTASPSKPVPAKNGKQ